MISTSKEFMKYFSAEGGDYSGVKSALDRFLRSSMDEVRLRQAREAAIKVLRVADLADHDMFREGVFRREASGTIAYEGQRDHAAHTLNNWLLGWYVYSNCASMKAQFHAAIKRRHWSGAFGSDEFFGHTWLYASLLHDIGYLFEGNLAALDPSTQSQQVETGVRVVNDYFVSGVWLGDAFQSTGRRRRLLKQLEFPAPSIGSNLSLLALESELTDLGDLKAITGLVRNTCMRLDEGVRRGVEPATGVLPADSFDLWEQHYKQFGCSGAANRIRSVERVFGHFAHHGLPSVGVRVLDHGVCSGLLLLKAATTAYSLIARWKEALNSPHANTKELALLSEQRSVYDYDAIFWWTGIVWATAATAMHNVQQLKRPWTPDVEGDALSVEEDPLAYLGVLVDSVQEWDRYSVFAVPDKLPTQGVDVRLQAIDGIVIVTFQSERQAEKVREELDRALIGWQQFLSICPEPPPPRRASV